MILIFEHTLYFSIPHICVTFVASVVFCVGQKSVRGDLWSIKAFRYHTCHTTSDRIGVITGIYRSWVK